MIDRVPRVSARRTAIALLAFFACVAAQAAGPSAAGAQPGGAAAHAGAVHTYVTVAGDNADRIVKKAMGDSPLKEELLRDALMKANPKVFTAGRNTRLRPGLTVTLPDQHAMMRQILLPLLDSREAAAHFPPPPASAEERRRWVRYP